MKAGQQMYQRSRCERATYRLYDLRGKQGRAGKSPFPPRVLKGGLCRLLNRALLLCVALIGQWRYSLLPTG
jgi:hypothetical protein